MSLIGKDLLRMLRGLEKSLGWPSFTWADRAYPCCPNQSTASKILGLGGFGMTSDLVLFVRKSTLPEVGPKEKQVLTYGGKRYRIDKVGNLPGDSVISLMCTDATGGA